MYIYIFFLYIYFYYQFKLQSADFKLLTGNDLTGFPYLSKINNL